MAKYLVNTSGVFLLLLSGVTSLGINYGQIADNLPPPEKVVPLMKTIGVSKVKLYDVDPKVIKAFAKTGIQMTVTLGNDAIVHISSNPKHAIDWVTKNVLSYLPYTNITSILIGNEVLTFNHTSLSVNLLPAMHNIHTALQTLHLDRQVSVTTTHNLAILETSYPPSSGAFRQDLRPCIAQILNFHIKTGSPFLINAYPYFAYKANPNQVPLDYVLFQSQSQSDQGTMDSGSGLHYDNMLFAQVDAVYSAMGPTYNNRVLIQVSETGWPSKGDDDEAGATPENAKKYNGNLIKLASQGRGTPMRPNCDLNIFVFALFNENLKPGPTSERNYGLFKPDGSPVYSLGFPTIQAVGNMTSSPAASTPTLAPPGSSSNGYLSISLAKKKYASVGLPFFWSALLIMWMV